MHTMAEVVDKYLLLVHRSNKDGRKASLKENGLGDWGILIRRGLKIGICF